MRSLFSRYNWKTPACYNLYRYFFSSKWIMRTCPVFVSPSFPYKMCRYFPDTHFCFILVLWEPFFPFLESIVFLLDLISPVIWSVLLPLFFRFLRICIRLSVNVWKLLFYTALHSLNTVLLVKVFRILLIHIWFCMKITHN